ncbi:hypothetical protein [Methanoregula sp. UBA64]|jgi:hypothetical protein|uniref:hypothetical protein n=1 Tax=Methanoregula sp. UBA64 TaxID=1915554 RepID=UPI0025F1374C|nr:hypothetical protein [Methanoregula sp. UBA64]
MSDNTTENETGIEHVIKDLQRKSEILREIQVFCSKKCKRWADLILLLTVLLTMGIAFLSLIVPVLIHLDGTANTIFGIIIALAGMGVLFLSISDRIFGINERYARHLQGEKILTDFIRECHSFRHVELKKYSDEKKMIKLNALKDRYSQIQQILPPNDISNLEFLKIKQQYYLKVDISKKLDLDHNLDIEKAASLNKNSD